MLEPVWVRFPRLGLLELCQLKYIITCIVILLLGSSKIYTICNHSFEGRQAFPVLHYCCFHMVSVGQHSAKVDPTNRFVCLTLALDIKCDCWHHFACCSMSKVQHNVWLDERSSVLVPLGCYLLSSHWCIALAASRVSFVVLYYIYRCATLWAHLLSPFSFISP